MFEFVCGLVLAGAFFRFFWSRKRRPGSIPVNSADVPISMELGGTSRSLLIAFGFILVMSAAVFTYTSLNRPHGNWDAWAMWNMKSRFLFLAGDRWRDLFAVNRALHLDYPLLLPTVNARCWTYVGKTPLLVPITVSWCFSYATIGLLYSSVALLRGRAQGLLAGIAMLGMPVFLREGASQYADVPLGFFIIMTFVMTLLHIRTGAKPYLLLAGTACGLAAWTKNEGSLFLVAFIMASLLVVLRYRGIKESLFKLLFFFLGLAPMLVLLLYFKWVFAPPSGVLFTEGANAILGKIFDLSRHAAIMKTTFYHLLYSVIAPVFLVFLFLAGVKVEDKDKEWLSIGFLALAITLTGYYFVYLTTAIPLEWILNNSLGRIFVQILPSAIFIFFLSVNPYVDEKTMMRQLTPVVSAKRGKRGIKRGKKKQIR
jgi:4-amino-4-deoxy-L-arabinose transferase-like glycosyltransferase